MSSLTAITSTPMIPPIPPRRYINCSSPPPGLLEKCPTHRDHHCKLICITCIELLCSACVLSTNYRHSDCCVIQLRNNVSQACEQVKTTLSDKIITLKDTANALQETLTKKKERMLVKRNETMAEIQRYFHRLKDRLLSKLHRQESELIKHLTENVSLQGTNLSLHIHQCDTMVHSLQEKKSMVDNFDQIYGNGDNTNAFLQNLFKVSNEINEFKQAKEDIEAARDAFLVIRFFVNAEAEQDILNSVIANVEVLSSCSNDQDSGNLESERINEVFANAPITSVDSDTDSESRIHDRTHHESALRVELPSQSNVDGREPVHTRVRSFERETRGHSPLANSDTNRSTTPSITITNETNDVLNIVNSAQDNTNETLHTNDITLNENTSTETNNIIATPIIENLSPSVSNPTPDTDGARSSSQSPNAEFEEDDLPPPYPGLPTPNIAPQPHELPPPYPGPPDPAPPPYAQFPEPQQPVSLLQHHQPRARLNGQSGGPRPQREVLLSPTRTNQEERPISPVTNVRRPRGPLKTFSINEVNDKRSSGTFAIAVYKNNSFLLVDRWNRKLKYFNDIGESFGGLLFREEPWDITKVSEELFAVTVPKLNILYKVKATPEAVITTGTITTLRKYACIAFQTHSELFICGQVPQFGEPVIDVIGIDGGPILLSFRRDIRGQELFSYPRYVEVTEDGIVVVCDWNLKCLVLFKLDGTALGRYKGTTEYPLNEPTGIELDHDTRSIYVIDSKRNSTEGAVHKVSMECACETVYKGQPDLRDARAISVYGMKMAVGSKNGILNLFSVRPRYN